MKSTIVILLTLIMLFKPLWPIVEYVVNYDYIVNVLCENKDKPKLNCDGKCYLAKQLAKERNENGENPFEQRQTSIEQVHPICFQSIIVFVFPELFSFFLKEPIKYSKILFSSPHILDLIQPPEFC
ncbi:MAG: hypothetical protein NWQ38_13780 [Cellulophaga sp.]|nr:hypothetical protein [Cellulophaga sp.]